MIERAQRGAHARPRWVVGVDIGGTNLVVGAIPFDGGPAVGVRWQETRPERGADAAVGDIARMAEAVIEETLDLHQGSRDDFVGVGIGCPGPLDPSEGVVIDTPNLGWKDYPIRDRVGDRLSIRR